MTSYQTLINQKKIKAKSKISEHANIVKKHSKYVYTIYGTTFKSYN